MDDPDIYQLSQAFRAALLKRERAAAVRLVKAYGPIWQRLSKRLDVLTKQIDDARAAGELINPFWLLRQERYQALLDQVSTEIAKFADVAGEVIGGEQQAAVRAAVRDSERLILTGAEQAGAVSGTFNRLPVPAIESMVGFLSDGSPLHSLLDDLAPSGRRKVEEELLSAIALGIGPRATANKIRDALGGNLARALTIARTETLRAYREASHQTYQQHADVLDGWIWVTGLSGRACAACIALHGTFHLLSERQAAHVRCRCTRIPAISGQPSPVSRGADWFAEQPAETQRRVLGSEAAYKAFRTGKLRLEDFVGHRDDPRWGASYYQLGVGRALNNEGRFPGNAARPVRIIQQILQIPQPAGKPVASGLKLPKRGELAAAGQRTLAAIEKVHGDGDLPQIPVEPERSRKRLGGYWYYNGNPPRPIKITVRKGAASQPELTLAHEIGHFLDQQGAGDRDHASKADSRFEDFRRVVEESAAVKELRRLVDLRRVEVTLPDGTRRDYPLDRRFLAYLLKPEEVWARAYAQYITLRSADETMREQLNRTRERRGQVYYPSQWDDEDFRLIAEAIDRLMIELGWRK